ncbi:NAD(P)H-hydrate dehydratase [Candidatus Micrarchaeota archaeon]|nr:NAD(P)H-hydrate dehydratase [Candidatus Micrarchaeota archaeon]
MEKRQKIQMISRGVLKKIYPTREKWVHKGDFGRLLVIGGSEQFTGSPIFNGMAALRAGVDLVFIVAPERAALIASSYSPNLISFPLEGKKLEEKHVEKVLNVVAELKPTGIAIGGGLWREEETLQAIRKIIKSVQLPVVIDADAVRALAENPRIIEEKACVLTPHADEFKALTGTKVGTALKERIEKTTDAAETFKTTILLKGNVDVIAEGISGRVALNKTGNPFMTKGGCGDTLAGICGALLARGNQPFEAACGAAFINGSAGDSAAKKLGEGLTAEDLIDFIPQAIK